MKDSINPIASSTVPPVERPAAVAPLRLLLAAGAALLLPLMALQLLWQPREGLAHLWLGSIVPSLSALLSMVLLFDLMMMLLLRSSRSAAQQRIDNAFIIAWVVSAALFGLMLVTQISLLSP